MPYRNAGRLIVVLTVLFAAVSSPAQTDTQTVVVFEDAGVFFAPDSSFDNHESVAHADNGRVAQRTVPLPKFDRPHTIRATVRIHPIPKDDIVVYDKWDRAGNVRLGIDNRADVELVKFVTAYGGETAHTVDITHLAPLLKGERTFKASIDTWVNPAWRIDFELQYATDTSVNQPYWARTLFYDESFTREQADSAALTAEIVVPQNVTRVKLYYLTSGHCTDGRGADEFVTRDNVLSVDDVVVYRYRPWRDDCEEFRGINPYTRRWSDGTWSSDYSRSGWCPGDVVRPLELDLTDHLTPGEHTVSCLIENIRPEDEDGHYGYWRVSAYVVGWK